MNGSTPSESRVIPLASSEALRTKAKGGRSVLHIHVRCLHPMLIRSLQESSLDPESPQTHEPTPTRSGATSLPARKQGVLRQQMKTLLGAFPRLG